MYLLQVLFLTGALSVSGIESKEVCEAKLVHIAEIKDTGFVEGHCTGPQGTVEIKAKK